MEPAYGNFEITIRTVDNIQYFGGYVDTFKDITNPFVHSTVLMDSGNKKFDVLYLNRTFSICQFLANRKISIFMELGYKWLSEYVQLPKKCPISKVKLNVYEIIQLYL